jgi:hypothetical protein
MFTKLQRFLIYTSRLWAFKFFRLTLIRKPFRISAHVYRTCILFRHPRTTSASHSLLKPFTSISWLCILLSWALMMATIHLVKWLESRHQRDGHQSSKSDYSHSWGATILTIIGAISEQGNIFTNSYLSKHSHGCRTKSKVIHVTGSSKTAIRL